MVENLFFKFSLKLSAEEFLAYYEGTAKQVIVRADDGRVLQLPANVLRSYVTHDGICGRFILECDQHYRFVSIKMITD